MAEKLAAGATKIIKGVQAVLTPDLVEIKGDLKALSIQVSEMDKRHTEGMNSLKNELRAEIRTVDTKLETKIDAVQQSVQELGKSLEFAQRLSVVEAKLKEIERNK